MSVAAVTSLGPNDCVLNLSSVVVTQCAESGRQKEFVYYLVEIVLSTFMSMFKGNRGNRKHPV